jgi:hypothetical protein
MNTTPTCSSPRSRFTRPVFLWALVALATEFAVEKFYHHASPPQGVRLLVLLPLIPALFFMVALVRAILHMDELQKRICLESVFIAFMLTLVLTFIFAGLDRAGIYHPTWDSLGTPMMFLWAVAYIFSSWRYR